MKKHLPSRFRYTLVPKHNFISQSMRLYALCLLLLSLLRVPAQEFCGTTFMDEELIRMHPEMESIYRGQQQVLNFKPATSAVVTIPVVIHVVYNTPAQQVSQQLLSQSIDVLTKDFRRQNSDAGNTGQFGGYQSPTGLWSQNYNNIAADCEIAFSLCDVTYDYTPYAAFDLGQNEYVVKNLFPYYQTYPPSKYLNVWVCNMTPNFLGYASFPGVPAHLDGVTIMYSSVGYSSPNFRVLTHEVGHWLGLRHIWGDCVCCDDFVSDTAPQQYNNGVMAAQPPFPNHPNQAPCAMWTACPGTNVYNNVYYPYVNMGDNYMDYSPSGCMNFFSQGQKQRMWFFLNSSRSSLLSNNACSRPTGLDEPLSEAASPQIYPNPANDRLLVANLKTGTPLVITNLMGMKVLETAASQEVTEIDVSHLPPGMYFLNRSRFVKE